MGALERRVARLERAQARALGDSEKALYEGIKTLSDDALHLGIIRGVAAIAANPSATAELRAEASADAERWIDELRQKWGNDLLERIDRAEQELVAMQARVKFPLPGLNIDLEPRTSDFSIGLKLLSEVSRGGDGGPDG